MDDFNSCDVESSSNKGKNPRIGRRAIASIIENSAVDRIEAEKTLKTLEDNIGTPGTNIARRYWFELFKAFASVTLRIDSRPSKTPTGDDVIRFISCLPSHLQSRRSDGKIAWTVIKNAKMHLDHALTFHYSEYKLSRHDALRIDAITQKLLDDGEITKDPVREVQDSPQSNSEPAFLTAKTEQFIDFLSKINLFSASEALPNNLATGNSRDPPTRFLFHCNNEHCGRTFNTVNLRDKHQVNCDAEPPARIDAVESGDEMTPTIVAGSQRKRKRQDINKVSEDFPKPCPDNNVCGVTKEFATEHLLRNHRTLHHDDKAQVHRCRRKR